MSYNVSGQFKYKNLEIGALHNRERHSSSTAVRPEYTLYWNDVYYGFNNTTAYARLRTGDEESALHTESSLQFNSYSIDKGTNFVNSFSGYDRVYKFGLTNGTRLEHNLFWDISDKHQLSGGVLLQHCFVLPKTSDLLQRFGSIGQSAQAQDLYYAGTDVQDGNGNDLKIYQNLFSFNRLSGGVFVQYRFSLQEKLFLTVGLRYDQAFDLYGKDASRYAGRKTDSYNGISPRLSLVYRPIKSLGIKLFAGRAFLAPSGVAKFEHYGGFFPVTDSLGNTSIQSGFWQLPNPGLQPEVINTGELSLDYTKGNFAVIANGYANLGQNFMRRKLGFVPINFSGVSVPVYSQNINDRNFLSYGGSLLFIYRLVFGKEEQGKLQIRAGYNFTDGLFSEAENSTRYSLPFFARHNAQLGLTLRYTGWVLSLDGLFRSASVNEGVENGQGQVVQLGNPAFFRLNAYTAYTLPLKNAGTQLSFFVRVLNATNARYYHTADNVSGNFTASPQNPIAVLGGVQARFGFKSKK